jgi:thiol-disulfide isomerase/thioredoxin
VPFCQLIGRRLVNLALYEQNGKVWEYRTSRLGNGRPGRLMLIDFWYSQCGPCLAAMHHIVELDQQYRQYGLDVVGIAYESGTQAQRVAQVNSIRGRYGIRYPTLLSGGSNCPVQSQFDVHEFPTLILLDENGDIVLRKKGLSQRDYEELKLEIYRRLIQ